MADDATVARRDRDGIETLGPLLFECARLLDEIARVEVNRQAGRRLLTPALVRLLPHLSREGIRPTELARRVDVTKQAIGQAIAGLAAMQLVELVPDPSDGRARLVRLTEAGESAYGHGRTVLAFYGGELASRVGSARVAQLARALAAVLPILQQWSTDGAPIPAGVPDGSASDRIPKPPARRRPPRPGGHRRQLY
jgi:MarR family transcriptional regulator, temperature-dependent positive regulator of motility